MIAAGIYERTQRHKSCSQIVAAVGGVQYNVCIRCTAVRCINALSRIDAIVATPDPRLLATRKWRRKLINTHVVAAQLLCIRINTV